MSFTVRMLKYSEYAKAYELTECVFMEFEAPEYPPEGVESFKEFLYSGEIEKRYLNGAFFMWGAFDGEKLAGIMAMRDGSHISLAFVEKEYHRMGVATMLWVELLKHCTENGNIEKITVNSSPYGFPFYKSLGFKETAEECTDSGIRYIPMEYLI